MQYIRTTNTDWGKVLNEKKSRLATFGKAQVYNFYFSSLSFVCNYSWKNELPCVGGSLCGGLNALLHIAVTFTTHRKRNVTICYIMFSFMKVFKEKRYRRYFQTVFCLCTRNIFLFYNYGLIHISYYLLVLSLLVDGWLDFQITCSSFFFVEILSFGFCIVNSECDAYLAVYNITVKSFYYFQCQSSLDPCLKPSRLISWFLLVCCSWN